MAALEPYYFKPNVLRSEDDEVDNRLKKIHFPDFVKVSTSVAGFSASHQFRVGPNDVT